MSAVVAAPEPAAALPPRPPRVAPPRPPLDLPRLPPRPKDWPDTAATVVSSWLLSSATMSQFQKFFFSSKNKLMDDFNVLRKARKDLKKTKDKICPLPLFLGLTMFLIRFTYGSEYSGSDPDPDLKPSGKILHFCVNAQLPQHPCQDRLPSLSFIFLGADIFIYM